MFMFVQFKFLNFWSINIFRNSVMKTCMTSLSLYFVMHFMSSFHHTNLVKELIVHFFCFFNHIVIFIIFLLEFCTFLATKYMIEVPIHNEFTAFYFFINFIMFFLVFIETMILVEYDAVKDR